MENEMVFIAESADVVGKVSVGAKSSIWFQAVLRGDFNTIHIGESTNIQDGAVIHVDLDSPVSIGNNVTIGHNCIIHGCEIKDNVLVGMGSTIMNGVIVHENSLIGANSLVTEGTIIPANSLVLGSPAKVVRKLTPEEVSGITSNARLYTENRLNFIGKSYSISEIGYIITQ